MIITLTMDSGTKEPLQITRSTSACYFSFSLEFQYKWKTLEYKLCCLQSIDLESSKGEYEIHFSLSC